MTLQEAYVKVQDALQLHVDEFAFMTSVQAHALVEKILIEEGLADDWALSDLKIDQSGDLGLSFAPKRPEFISINVDWPQATTNNMPN